MIKDKIFSYLKPCLLSLILMLVQPIAVSAQATVSPTMGNIPQAALSLSPSSGVINRGCGFPVEVILNTGGASTEGADAILTYDTTKLSASVTSGSIYPDYPNVGNEIQAGGRIAISGSSTTSNTYNGTGTLATIQFQILPNAQPGPTIINFDFTPGSTADSGVAIRSGADILSSATGASFTIGSGTQCLNVVGCAASPTNVNTTSPRNNQTLDSASGSFNWSNGRITATSSCTDFDRIILRIADAPDKLGSCTQSLYQREWLKQGKNLTPDGGAGGINCASAVTKSSEQASLVSIQSLSLATLKSELQSDGKTFPLQEGNTYYWTIFNVVGPGEQSRPDGLKGWSCANCPFPFPSTAQLPSQLNFDQNTTKFQYVAPPTPTTPPVTTLEFKLAEGENPDDDYKDPNHQRWNNIAWISYTAQGQRITHSFQPKTCPPGEECQAFPKGFRTIFVLFRYSNGTKEVKSAQINLIPKPIISSISCNFGTGGTGTLVTVRGSNLGSEIGSVKVGNQTGLISAGAWADHQINAALSNQFEGSKSVEVTTADGFTPRRSICALGSSLINFQAALSCRSLAKPLTIASLEVRELTGTLPIYKNDKNTFNTDGNPAGTFPRLERGRDYKFIIKAPTSLKQTFVFTGSEGTTELIGFNLPVGDIFPEVGDGVINSQDYAELRRQWVITRDVQKRADLNLDGRVNSLDYSCLVSNFNKSSGEVDLRPRPSVVPTPQTSGVPLVPTVPAASASPTPSVTPASATSPSPSPAETLTPAPTLTPTPSAVETPSPTATVTLTATPVPSETPGP